MLLPKILKSTVEKKIVDFFMFVQRLVINLHHKNILKQNV